MTLRAMLVGAVVSALFLGSVDAQETRPKGGDKPASAPKLTDPALLKIQGAIDKLVADGTIDKSKARWKTRVPKFPEVQFTKGKKYFWHLQTNHGTMKIELLPSVAPKHVASFAYLTLMGFYDGLTFHRVIPGFMAQGGCPEGTGRGGPNYRFGIETDPNVKHDKRGVVATARTNAPNSDGSQFYITFKATPHLDGGYTVFGRVVKGIESLDGMEKLGSRTGRPTEKISIAKAWLTVE